MLENTKEFKFFKHYCDLKKLNHKYAIGRINDEGTYLEFLDGNQSTHIAYQGKNLQDGVLYKTSPATCGYGTPEGGDGSCEVGARKLTCSCYSPNKCAVYFIENVDLENFNYTFNYNEYCNLNDIINKH